MGRCMLCSSSVYRHVTCPTSGISAVINNGVLLHGRKKSGKLCILETTPRTTRMHRSITTGERSDDRLGDESHRCGFCVSRSEWQGENLWRVLVDRSKQRRIVCSLISQISGFDQSFASPYFVASTVSRKGVSMLTSERYDTLAIVTLDIVTSFEASTARHQHKAIAP